MSGRFAQKPKRGQRQQTLDQARKPTGHGGWRPGAGRKPSGTRLGPMHRTRPEIAADRPLHVRLRMAPEAGRLRRRHAYQAVRHALRRVLARADMRVVHASIQHNHVHLIVEAEHREALSRGMRSLCISLSRRLNRRLGRKGRVIRCRYEATAIIAPRQARSCLAYILNNWRRHRRRERSDRRRQGCARRAPIDPYSTASSFDGWRELSPAMARATLPPEYEPLPCARATTWLLTTGWKRHGPIGIHERPGPWDA